jgi:site-specific DNA-methyltransferase (adenine-specific)/modification methylase
MNFLDGDIYQGDCLEVMKGIPDHSIGMILCDLPYGTTQNKWDSVIPLDKLWEEYRRIVKPRGVIALTSQGIFTARLILSNEAWFRYKFVWVKSKATNFLNARRQPLRQHEDICIFYKQQPEYRPIMWKAEPYDKGTRKAQFTGSYGDFRPVQVKSEGERFPTDTLYCKTAESEAGGRVWHPTQKPVALGRYLIRMFTGPKDVVLDNAFGSGSFLVAAAMEGRRYIGIEKNEEVHLFKKERIDYIQVAKTRLEEVRKLIQANEELPPLLSALQPSAHNGQIKKRGMVDVDEVLRQADRSTV